jgi:hypothetical protein
VYCVKYIIFKTVDYFYFSFCLNNKLFLQNFENLTFFNISFIINNSSVSGLLSGLLSGLRLTFVYVIDNGGSIRCDGILHKKISLERN